MKNIVKYNILIDCGNSFTKMAICEVGKTTLTEIHEIETGFPAKLLINQFKVLKESNVIQHIYVVNSKALKAISKFLNDISAYFASAPIKIFNVHDFSKVIDLSNIKVKEEIGNDLLLQCWYLINHHKHAAIISLGTVHTIVVMKNKRFESVMLIPSFSKGIQNISSLTAINKKYLPNIYNAKTGLNTFDAFALGAITLFRGFINELKNAYKLKDNEIIITGGDIVRFPTINKKYHCNKFLNLYALAEFVKDIK